MKNTIDTPPKCTLKLRFTPSSSHGESLSFEALRTSVLLSSSPQETGDTARIRLHGPSLNNFFQMGMADAKTTQQTSIFSILSQAEVQIEAYSENQSPTLIFHGKVSQCKSVLQGTERFLEVLAQSSLLYTTLPSAPLSYENPVYASEILKSLCDTQQIQLQNNGFEALLQPPFLLQGNFLQQVKNLVNAQNGFFHFDTLQKTLFVGKDELLKPTDALKIPTDALYENVHFSDSFLSLSCLFQPNLQLGQSITLQSNLLKATDSSLLGESAYLPPWNGSWILDSLKHELSTEKTSSKWKTTLLAHRSA
ncbi:hypothetical protein FAI40_04660 [Acetobacteraceae bacterium]|nr:hypothetical protein FAI40_04660 [Acetobacteraceae bacterium]